MTEWLTVRQVQEMLRVDRVTVYRMLNDGRIKGIKLGQQWRFAQSEIERLLGGDPHAKTAPETPPQIQDFPVDCAQNVQEIYAGILGVGAVMTILSGQPLTQVHYAGPFCRLVQSTPAGRAACRASWAQIASAGGRTTPFLPCHAGLRYVRAAIEYEGQPTAWLISGQFRLKQPAEAAEEQRLQEVAQRCGLAADELRAAAATIPLLSAGQRQQVLEWTPKVARTIQSFLCERADLMKRLQQISSLSAIQSKLSDLPIS